MLWPVTFSRWSEIEYMILARDGIIRVWRSRENPGAASRSNEPPATQSAMQENRKSPNEETFVERSFFLILYA